MNKSLHADDLFSNNENAENLKKQFLQRKETFENKELKLNLKKSKVIVSVSKDKALMSKVDPRAKCGKRVIVNLVIYIKCGK